MRMTVLHIGCTTFACFGQSLFREKQNYAGFLVSWLAGWLVLVMARLGLQWRECGERKRAAMDTAVTTQTKIFKVSQVGEDQLGYIDADQVIYKVRWGAGVPVGRVDAEGRVFRKTTHDERELGRFTTSGHVYSHGLFEGGALGWVDPDGVVVQGGLILGEEEVGRVDGPQPAAAAAALLLLFLPDDAEANKQMTR